MPPADAALDPLDRPAEALWYEFESFCWEGANADRFGSRGGLWLPSCPWYGLLDWQRDLARRLAAAVLASESERPGAGGATMTVEERAGKFFDDWNAGAFHHDDVPSVLAAAFREAEAEAAAAAVLAAAADRPAAGKCPRCRGNTIVPVIDWRLPRPVTGYQPCPNCRGTGKVNDAGGRS